MANYNLLNGLTTNKVRMKRNEEKNGQIKPTMKHSF